MDYKKKYKEALEIMKDCIPDKDGLVHIRPCEIFHELKESEDERIRNFLISKMKEVGNVWKEYSSKDIIAWLEKQGEQKANEIHPIFRVGDYIKNKNTSDKVVIEQLNVESEVYYYTSYDGAAVNHSDFPFSKQDEWELIVQKSVEQKSAWSEEDEKHYQGCLHVMNIVLNAKPYPYYNDYLWLKSIKERIKGE